MNLPVAGEIRQRQDHFHRGRRSGRPRAGLSRSRSKVLDYRQLTKLKGTYVDALPAADSTRDAPRLTPRFNQAGAATGRLSSSNPNLQNIPIRTEARPRDSRRFRPRSRAGSWSSPTIRRSSCACWRTCRDDPVLVDAFREWRRHPHAHRGRSLQGQSADGTPEMRRNAKAVNFGIVYGQTPFGLAAKPGHRPQRSRTLHSALLRALRGRAHIHRYDHRGGAAAGRRENALRPPTAHSGYAEPQSQPPAVSPSAPRSTRRCRARRRT